jgi:F0F1-type ATP synthase membrane subunit a
MRAVLWTIECISYLLRAFTLGIRLFANLLAGHALLHILIAGAWYFFINTIFLASGIQTVLILLIFLLEFVVSMVQALVLTILVCLYLQEHILSIYNSYPTNEC